MAFPSPKINDKDGPTIGIPMKEVALPEFCGSRLMDFVTEKYGKDGRKLCSCSTVDLMAGGCRCGGV